MQIQRPAAGRSARRAADRLADDLHRARARRRPGLRHHPRRLAVAQHLPRRDLGLRPADRHARQRRRRPARARQDRPARRAVHGRAVGPGRHRRHRSGASTARPARSRCSRPSAPMPAPASATSSTTASSRQFFVSDLDTGLIYRLDWTGLIIDTFDHGVTGAAGDGPAAGCRRRQLHGHPEPRLQRARIRRPGATRSRSGACGAWPSMAAASTTPSPTRLRRSGRSASSSTAPSPTTRAGSSTSPASPAPIPSPTSLFDGQGRMILAQRGRQRGSYDYSVFAEPLQSSVVRYRREIPDDPATPGTWVPVPDEYAIGFRPDGRNTTGGIALGYGYDQLGQMRVGACNEYPVDDGRVAARQPGARRAARRRRPGDRARPAGQRPQPRAPGERSAVPVRISPTTTASSIDPANQGHMGDVEIWQPCQGGGYGYLHPAVLPAAGLHAAAARHLQPDARQGSRAVRSACPAASASSAPTRSASPTPARAGIGARSRSTTGCPPIRPARSCTSTAAAVAVRADSGRPTYQCTYPPVFLCPGDSVDLYVTVDLPAATPTSATSPTPRASSGRPGYGDANPADDFDFASAQVPNERCPPPHGEQTNLKIEKEAAPICDDGGDAWLCVYLVTVTNTGPGVYTGNIVVTTRCRSPTRSSGRRIRRGPAPTPARCTRAPTRAPACPTVRAAASSTRSTASSCGSGSTCPKANWSTPASAGSTTRRGSPSPRAAAR